MLSTLAQPGDRWDVTDALRLSPARSLVLGAAWDNLLEDGQTLVIEGLGGQPVNAHYDANRHAMVWLTDAKPNLLNAEGNWLELLSVAPLRFALRRIDAAPSPAPSAAANTPGLKLSFVEEDQAMLRQVAVSPDAFALRTQAAFFAGSPGFDELLSLPFLREVEPFPHQLKTAQTVLRRFRGRALLCDEVGLGKTVEAGMILLELLMRKLARRVLILTPSSLVEQWRGELGRKFGVSVVTPEDELFKQDGDAAWGKHERILASYHKVRREPYRSLVSEQEWDMVIIDEAHHFRNKNTVLWKLASGLRKKYALLLTATPVQNNLEELHNLVTLLQPGLLSTAKQFQQQFVDKKDKLSPKNLDQLHGLLAEAMVRNRRSNVTANLTRRFASTLAVTPAAAEQALYQAVTEFVKPRLRALGTADGAGRGISRIALITLQRELGSSSLAAADTLAKLAESARPGERETLAALQQQALAAPNAKLGALLKLTREWPDKLLIFTQFRRTQEAIIATLRQAGERVVQFHGGMGRMDKEAAVQAFQNDARILVSTESGSEGRNLQFCHALCNFDLPWNPMRIEQRIGRLSRIGQTRDVRVFNLVSAGTIEADVLRVLEAKINLFELVVGEVEMVLGNLEDEREFEDVVLDLWVQAEDDAHFRAHIDALGEQMVSAKQAYLDQVKIEDKLFANKFEAQD